MSATEEQTQQQIIEAIRSLKYGSVHIVVHDSRIVQVERTEKVRFDAPRQHPQ